MKFEEWWHTKGFTLVRNRVDLLAENAWDAGIEAERARLLEPMERLASSWLHAHTWTEGHQLDCRRCELEAAIREAREGRKNG